MITAPLAKKNKKLFGADRRKGYLPGMEPMCCASALAAILSKFLIGGSKGDLVTSWRKEPIMRPGVKGQESSSKKVAPVHPGTVP